MDNYSIVQILLLMYYYQLKKNQNRLDTIFFDNVIIALLRTCELVTHYPVPLYSSKYEK